MMEAMEFISSSCSLVYLKFSWENRGSRVNPRYFHMYAKRKNEVIQMNKIIWETLKRFSKDIMSLNMVGYFPQSNT